MKASDIVVESRALGSGARRCCCGFAPNCLWPLELADTARACRTGCRSAALSAAAAACFCGSAGHKFSLPCGVPGRSALQLRDMDCCAASAAVSAALTPGVRSSPLLAAVSLQCCESSGCALAHTAAASLAAISLQC